MDIGTRSIKREHYERLKSSSAIIIETTADGYVVHQWSRDGVAPQSTYATAPEALARAAQLMKVASPVVPQNWPEQVQIGSVSAEQSA